MTGRDIAEMVALGALWGASYLFMRHAAPAFGAVPLIWLRVTLASLVLVPLLLWHGEGPELRREIRPLALVGVLNSGVPFVLIAWATLSVTAGFAAIVNASTPIFTALVGALWLGDRLDRSRSVGLAIGFAGVLLLSIDKADFRPGGSGWAVLALLGAALCYGFAANTAKRHLAGVGARVGAGGTQAVSSLLLAPLAWWLWPEQMPGPSQWGAAALLALVSTALANLLFFRLLGRLGASRTVTVTFLIPVFGSLWGALFLGEAVTGAMWRGGAVILLGTALATGVLRPAWLTRRG
ncbi:DMT family transporter [Leptothrix discophora]|uniref:DMT family transporter n=2 Tax=Leptothrix discophora TaxID=89 RepID=A0ABT9G2Q7_LEPDI|nr:DMT family transporter [Leptothrix discophora]MDP4300772.1 DMT family transporter [Leptothrix discophora]